MGLIQEFRDFALRGNVVDMAVGIVIGAAFGTIVSSFVGDIVTPLIGLLGNVDFNDQALTLREGTGEDDPDIVLKYGSFITAVINFLIVAIAIFIVIKMMNTATERFKKQQTPPPAAVPKEEVLLGEIRDQLVKLNTKS